jgi:hypothetical protein
VTLVWPWCDPSRDREWFCSALDCAVVAATYVHSQYVECTSALTKPQMPERVEVFRSAVVSSPVMSAFMAAAPAVCVCVLYYAA